MIRLRPRTFHEPIKALVGTESVGARSKSEIKSRFIAHPLFRLGPNGYQVAQTLHVFGAARRHSPIRAVPGIFGSDLEGLLDRDLLTSRLLRRVA